MTVSANVVLVDEALICRPAIWSPGWQGVSGEPTVLVHLDVRLSGAGTGSWQWVLAGEQDWSTALVR
jgi:hypothetical protein